MDDDTAPGQIVEAEGYQQPEVMPASDQNQTEQTDPISPDQTQGEALPETASDRTREQFEKLKEENRKLKEQANRQTYGDSVLGSLRPQQAVPALDPQQVNAIQAQYVAQDGTVDINGFNNAITQANQQALEAKARAHEAEQRMIRFEEDQQQRETVALHPELDPQSDSFDPTFWELVRNRVLTNMYEGKQEKLLAVADDLKRVYRSTTPVNVAQVEEAAVAKYKDAQQNRQQQGPIETGRGQPRRTSDADLTELRERTRKGDPAALSERLRKAGL